VALGFPCWMQYTSACFSDNPTGIVPGLLINSHVSQIQSTIFKKPSPVQLFAGKG